MSTTTHSLNEFPVKTPPYVDMRVHLDLMTLNWIVNVRITALIHRKHTKRGRFYPHQVGTTTCVSDEPNQKLLEHLLQKSLWQGRYYLSKGEYDETKYDRKTDNIVKTGRKIKFNEWRFCDKSYNVIEVGHV